MTEPAFILVGPQMGENVGACARAMWNFGLSTMRIVNPRDGWPNDRAVAMASGASRVLDAATIHEDTAGAVADLGFVYATTARPRELTKDVMTPAAAASDMRARIGRGEAVGVLFGRERTGLENEDVVRASAIVTVPVNPAFPSLNLGQCALLMAYEWSKAADETPPVSEAELRGGPAKRGELEALLAFMEGELEDSGFFWPEHKRESMRAALRNLHFRLPLSDADLKMLWGTTRALSERRRSKDRTAGDRPAGDR